MKGLSEVLANSIHERELLYFSSNRINSHEPHYYICIKRTENDVLILSVCTSQFETVRKFVELRSLPTETLVYVPCKLKDSESPFKKDTYINCNDTHSYTIDDIKSMHEIGAISIEGKLPEEYYEQIIIGLQKSPLISKELKEILPKPQ